MNEVIHTVRPGDLRGGEESVCERNVNSFEKVGKVALTGAILDRPREGVGDTGRGSG